jgi:ABC-type transporter Mla subunit MlaD
MNTQWWHDHVVVFLQDLLIVGALMTAIGIGIKRIYTTARSVEKILDFTVNEKKRREDLAKELATHIAAQHQRDEARNAQIQELVATVREISREVRPNGGSSMKDVLNHTAEKVSDIHTRVSVLEEWKRHEDRV